MGAAMAVVTGATGGFDNFGVGEVLERVRVRV